MRTSRILSFFSKRSVGRAAEGRLAVLYDGACKLCRNSIRLLRNYDNSGRLDLLDFHDPSVRKRFPQFPLDALMKEVHVVDDHGNYWRAGRAVEKILQAQHGARTVLAWLWYLPGFAFIADHEYKQIAGTRYKR